MLIPLPGVIATAGGTAIERRPKSNDFAGFLTIILYGRVTPPFFDGSKYNRHQRAKATGFGESHGS